ncbi:hypothetical protein BHE74_00001159 [Ensete ventricosum]|uniref:Uncharacterized protein n=1 Tax=Ensete ventricosum TaxID=4639 RepID=A0A445M9P2_ENSVE|nr:hypothetical protein BHE74_00001159 [Ensete ventricosum]RZR70963.1 hypothetical protein BHM03_00002521 [Ensete ventricosum]
MDEFSKAKGRDDKSNRVESSEGRCYPPVKGLRRVTIRTNKVSTNGVVVTMYWHHPLYYISGQTSYNMGFEKHFERIALCQHHNETHWLVEHRSVFDASTEYSIHEENRGGKNKRKQETHLSVVL